MVRTTVKMVTTNAIAVISLITVSFTAIKSKFVLNSVVLIDLSFF